MDVLVYDAMLLTLNDEGWIEKGYVCLKDKQIVRIGEGEPPERYLQSAKKVIKATDKIVIPGLINAHNHAAMSLLRGLADDLPLDKWLNEYIFPAERALVNEEFVYWGTASRLGDAFKWDYLFCRWLFL